MAFRPDPFCSSEPLGARLKGSNGRFAVGLPHRNYSVFKQADLNKGEVKERIRMELRIRWGDEGGEGPFDKLRDRGSPSVRLNKRFKWRSCSGASPSQLLCLACHQKSPQYVKVVSGRKRVKHTRG